MPVMRGWRPPRLVWIDCRACGRLGHPPEAVTTVDRETGERVWTCPDCALPADARRRVVRARLGMHPDDGAERITYREHLARRSSGDL